MKANEMPEKIYLFDYNDAMVTPLEGDTVYVREDAFIKNAYAWLDENLIYYWEQLNVDDTAELLDNFKKAISV